MNCIRNLRQLIIKNRIIIDAENYEELEMFTKVCKKRESLLTSEILLLIIAISTWQLSIEK